MNFRLFIVLTLASYSVLAQEINLQLRDSLSGEPIPFATVMTNFGENAISNEEGVFRLIRETSFVPEDSIFISCMGFKPFGEAIQQLSDSLLLLSPKAIELNAVILSQNNLSAIEVIKKARERVKDKYDLSLTKKTFFLRESFDQRWVQRDLKVKKATIKEFKQTFWDSLFKSIPVKDDWHTESYGELYGDWSEEQQKLILKRAVELADTINEKGYDQIENKITTVLDENVKENSYFKFKSGIFSTKVDRDEVIEQESDSTSVDTKKEKEEEEFPEEEAFHRGRKNRLKELFNSLIKRDRLDITVLNKSHLYDYEIINFTYVAGVPVYIIRFQPNGRKGKYKGNTWYDDAKGYKGRGGRKGKGRGKHWTPVSDNDQERWKIGSTQWTNWTQRAKGKKEKSKGKYMAKGKGGKKGDKGKGKGKGKGKTKTKTKTKTKSNTKGKKDSRPNSPGRQAAAAAEAEAAAA